jgi:hypothetical protein
MEIPLRELAINDTPFFRAAIMHCVGVLGGIIANRIGLSDRQEPHVASQS